MLHFPPPLNRIRGLAEAVSRSAMNQPPAAKFESLLDGYPLADLERHDGPIYGLWQDLSLAYFNAAWDRFALQNGGDTEFLDRWSEGASILEAFPEKLRAFYKLSYEKCLATGEPWEHEYECSSPSVFRKFHQIVYPLKDAALIVVNSLVAEQPHDPSQGETGNVDESLYRDEDGFVHQCAHCRRVQRQSDELTWDWVPDWVASIPPDSTHTFCPTCYGHYWGKPGS